MKMINLMILGLAANKIPAPDPATKQNISTQSGLTKEPSYILLKKNKM